MRAQFEAPPEVEVQDKSLWLRLLDFLEHPLLLWAAGIVAAMLGYFIYPVLSICGICVLLAFHRAKVVVGVRLRWQLASYVALFILTTFGLLGVGVLIKKHVPQLATLSDIRELLGQSKTPQVSTEQQAQPMPAVPPAETPKPTANKGIPAPIIQAGPTYGNIKERAIDLSKEMKNTACDTPGWNAPYCLPDHPHRPAPSTPEQQTVGQLTFHRFLFRDFDKLVALRDEFAQLHIADEDLNLLLRSVSMMRDAELVARDKGVKLPVRLSASEIDMMADKLAAMADQVPNK